MSRSGNRVEPASGSWERVPAGLSAVRRRPRRTDADGRWGVARLVAQREAERRTACDAPETAPEAADVPSPPAPREPVPVAPPAPRAPLPAPPLVPRPPLPAPRRPHAVTRRGPVVPNASDARAARPRIEPDLSLFGFARHTRGRVGARVFTAFFVVIFALIAVQTIASIV